MSREQLPSVAEVVQIPAALTAVASPDWEDANGHVNVAHFYDLHISASEAALALVGIDEEYRLAHRHGVFSIEQHFLFHSEVRVGEELSAHVRWLDRGDKVFHGVSILVNHTTGRIANTLEVLEGHVDLEGRRATPFASEVAERIDAAVAGHRALTWPVPLAGSMGVRRRADA